MSIKDLFSSKLWSLRNLFVWGNIILLGFFVATLLSDANREWKCYQKEYKEKEIARAEEMLAQAKDEEAKTVAQRALRAAKSMKIEIRQIWSPNIGAVDRCITCHLGYDGLSNTSLTTPYTEQPYTASAESPAFDIHKAHDIQEFGCVVCHGGQGYATETKAAHGEVKHWEKPLLKGVMLQASCMKCHDNTEELIINDKVYPSEVIRAEELFEFHGCIGCHQIGGEGGPISVDLKHETSVKPLSRIDFAYTGLPHQERTLGNWIKLHFTKDPTTLVPGDPKAEFNAEPIAPSGMPAYHMNEEDANALTAYILGLNREGIPPEYITTRPPKPEPRYANAVQRGRYVYDKYGCAACHGSEARGGVRNYNYRYDVMPNLRRAVSAYNRQDLKEKLHVGVPIVSKRDPQGPPPPLYMPPWGNKISEEEMDDLVTYLFSIKE